MSIVKQHVTVLEVLLKTYLYLKRVEDTSSNTQYTEVARPPVAALRGMGPADYLGADDTVRARGGHGTFPP